MKSKNKKKEDYLKASRRGSREAEFELYGHPLGHARVHKSKKAYDRKKLKRILKAGSGDLLSYL